MGYITITTEKNETYSSISNHFIDYYMTDANGEFVKVYLYLVRLMSSTAPVSVADIADHFNLTEKEICRAIKYWISQDVLKLNYDQTGELTGITLLPLKEKVTGKDLLSIDNIAFFKTPARNTQPQPEASNKEAARNSAYSLLTDKRNGKTPSEQESQAAFPVTLPAKKSYTPAMAKKASEDDAFADIIYEAETYFGRMLSANDMEILVYIHDQLGFSTELMEYLIEYCVTLGKKSLRYAETVAINWYKAGVRTVAEAKTASQDFNPIYKSVFKQLGINRQTPTSIEIAYMESWNKELGFDLPVILEACQRAILAKPHSANFAYINGILENWHKHNIKTLRDIEKMDKSFHEQKAQAGAQNTRSKSKSTSFGNFENKDMSKELDEMEQLFLKEINTQ